MDDCLIIGGGVIGLSLAYELAGSGLKVHLLDRAQLGQEASWAGAGMLPPGSQAEGATGLQRLAALSNRIHARWAEELLESTGIDNGYQCCGAIYLNSDPLQSDESLSIKQLEENWLSIDIQFQRLSPQELQSLEPQLTGTLSAENSMVAHHLPDEAQVRNPRHLKALKMACLQRGVKISCGVLAHHAETRNGKVEHLITSQGKMTAGNYCFATGAWSQTVVHSLGIHLPVKPIRGQIVLLHCDQQPLRRIVNCQKQYLVPRVDGRVLIGSTEEDVGFVKANTTEGISGLLDFAQQICPSLASAEIERCWSGLRPYTPDEKPYLGRLAELQNTFIAAGHFRSGLQLSTATALVMRQLICAEKPEVELDEFQPDRCPQH